MNKLLFLSLVASLTASFNTFGATCNYVGASGYLGSLYYTGPCAVCPAQNDTAFVENTTLIDCTADSAANSTFSSPWNPGAYDDSGDYYDYRAIVKNSKNKK